MSEKLLRYGLNKSDRSRLKPEYIEKIKQTVDSRPFEGDEFASELELHDQEYFEAAQQLLKDYSDWMEENLDLNVEERLPKITDIHFFNENNYEKLRQKVGSPFGDSFVAVHGKKLFVRAENKNQALCHLGHELVHALSGSKLVLRDRLVFLARSGLRSTAETGENRITEKRSSFYALDEALVESLNLQILNAIKDKRGIDYTAETIIGYWNNIILFDAIFQRVAEVLKMSRQELNKILYSSLILGQTGDLKIFRKAFGTDALRILVHYDHRASVPNKNFEELCNIIGIDVRDLYSKFDAYLSGQTVNLFSGISVQRPAIKS